MNLPLWVIKVHSTLNLVVGGYPEGDDLYWGEAWCHGEDFPSMGGVIQIFFGLWVRHARRVPSNNVEVCSSDHPGSTVPLDLIGGLAHTSGGSSCQVTQKLAVPPTSVGPAYIIGEGKIATMVLAGSRTPSSKTAACCFMRQSKGTSSSLVQPPTGCSRRTGFL